MSTARRRSEEYAEVDVEASGRSFSAGERSRVERSEELGKIEARLNHRVFGLERGSGPELCSREYAAPMSEIAWGSESQWYAAPGKSKLAIGSRAGITDDKGKWRLPSTPRDRPVSLQPATSGPGRPHQSRTGASARRSKSPRLNLIRASMVCRGYVLLTSPTRCSDTAKGWRVSARRGG